MKRIMIVFTALALSLILCSSLKNEVIPELTQTEHTEITEETAEFVELDIPDEFDYVIAHGKYFITGYHGTDSVVRIPYGVYGVAAGAFEWRLDITEVIFPDSLETLESYAFYSCKKLESIVLSKNLKVIGERCFAYTGLRNRVVIPDSVTEIGESAFRGSDFSEIILPKNIEKLEESTFEFCYNLEKVTIPPKVKSIGKSCFWCCISLSDITLNEGLEYIGEYAFYDALRGSKINLPSTLEKVGSLPFGEYERYANSKERTFTAPYYKEIYNIFKPYGEITYTDEQLLFTLIKKLADSVYKNSYLLCDLNFDGQPEVMAFDGNQMKIIRENSKKSSTIFVDETLINSPSDKISIGDFNRRLLHCRDKDGREFYIFAGEYENLNYPAVAFELNSKTDSRIVSILDAGPTKFNYYYYKDICEAEISAKTDKYSESDRIYCAANIMVGTEYSFCSHTTNGCDIGKYFSQDFRSTVDKYASQYEIIAEYNLDEYLKYLDECKANGESVRGDRVSLGTFSDEPREFREYGYKLEDAERITINEIRYPVDVCKLTVYVNEDNKFDFETLAGFSELTWLTIETDGDIDLSGIEKLDSLKRLDLTVKKGNVKLPELPEITALTLNGDFESLDFIKNMPSLKFIKLALYSEKSDEYYNPVKNSESLEFVELSKSRYDGEYYFTENQEKTLSGKRR